MDGGSLFSKNENAMKTFDLIRKNMSIQQHIQTESISNMFLGGMIMLANVDYLGLTDYVVKAVIGGLVWFGFKVAQDYYSERIKHHVKSKHKEHDGKKE
jgi:hypothetical protein